MGMRYFCHQGAISINFQTAKHTTACTNRWIQAEGHCLENNREHKECNGRGPAQCSFALPTPLHGSKHNCKRVKRVWLLLAWAAQWLSGYNCQPQLQLRQQERVRGRDTLSFVFTWDSAVLTKHMGGKQIIPTGRLEVFGRSPPNLSFFFWDRKYLELQECCQKDSFWVYSTLHFSTCVPSSMLL